MEGGANNVIKECVVLDGKIINIGPWDDQDGNNLMPEGAVIESREFEYDPNQGWYEVGTVAMPTDKERIAMLEDAVNFLLGL